MQDRPHPDLNMLAGGMGFKSRPDRGVKGKRLRSLRRLKKTLDIEIGMQVYGRWLLFSQDRSGGLICAPEKRRKAALWLSTEVPLGGVYRTASIRRRLVAGIERLVGQQDVNPIGPVSLCSWVSAGIIRNRGRF
jgi:hypothetical protein